jgi:hypothetical protein
MTPVQMRRLPFPTSSRQQPTFDSVDVDDELSYQNDEYDESN